MHRKINKYISLNTDIRDIPLTAPSLKLLKRNFVATQPDAQYPPTKAFLNYTINSIQPLIFAGNVVITTPKNNRDYRRNIKESDFLPFFSFFFCRNNRRWAGNFHVIEKAHSPPHRSFQARNIRGSRINGPLIGFENNAKEKRHANCATNYCSPLPPL